MELVALAPATAPHFHPPQRTSSPVRGTVRGQTERTRSRSTWSASVAATWTAATLLRSPRARRRRPPHRPGSQVGRKATGSDNRYKSLEAFLEAQRESPPTTDPLGGPLTPYNDSPVDWIFIAVFRQVMSGVASWQSPLAFWGTEAYDGMLEVAHAQQWGRTLQETEDSALSVIDNLLPEEGKARFRSALKADKFGTELNAWITAAFFPFMVGKCEVEARSQEDLAQIPEGEAWNCAVKIEKCRWLEKSGCVGMCVGLCKRPMQRMFGEVLGMPLSMEPNMEDLSCTMVFGKKPVEWQQDDLRDQPCFSTCATARSQGACPKLT
ncbi:unnamed protein product [Durusdinium trenchii]|uniref:Beta-carotene isomerase D27-like C-terminal domain-containing protein n=1 Tax=Durusdinium trenchii TaxID=1381693 RepID=A0ABP0NBL9_9DINO